MIALSIQDKPSRDLIATLASNFERTVYIVDTVEPDRPDERTWNNQRIAHMVGIRNLLLNKVRDVAPEYFLSLDSDVLLAPQGITTLFHAIERFDVVGGKCYLDWPGRVCPSYAMYSNQNLLRPDAGGGVFECDCVFAIKLMKSWVYQVDYRHQRLGEDVGWCQAVKEQGGKIGWDGRVVNKHVMRPELIDQVDARCGF